LNCCDISYSADIGKGFKINHAIGIVISECKIGDNFTVFQNSTIGKNGDSKGNCCNSPTIGNKVTCYTGCVVAGCVQIGTNANIGANSVVLKDIPPNKVVIGSKCLFA